MANHQPSKGGKPDKILRDALIIALNRKANVDGTPTKKLHIMVDKLVKMAIEGDRAAIEHIWDRVEGKAQQGVTLSGDGDAPLVPIITVTLAKGDD